MDEKSLGKHLQAARKAAGLTQQDLCHAANLSYSTLAKIERGAIKSPSIFTIQSIAAALGTNLDALLGTAGLKSSNRRLGRSKSGASFIYFDVNGCLVRFYQGAAARLAQDHNLPPDVVETACLHFNDAACRGQLTLDDFNQALGERLGLSGVDWAAYYLEVAEPLLEMHEVLDWASKQYRIGLLTNIMPGLLDSLLALGKVPDLPYDVIVDSSKVGLIKPDPQIYSYATEQAGVPANEIIFVDDTQANLIAAEKQGWNVVWFDYARPTESAQHLREVLEPAQG